MINRYQADDDFDTIIGNSRQRPVFLFKHSNVCPISAAACRHFNEFADSTPDAEFWQVLVREDRPLSLAIAERSAIAHQSPQIILFHKGEPVWHGSHHEIAVKTLDKKLLDCVK